MASTRDLACNPGTCPDWKSNWQHFGSQGGAQSSEPQQSELPLYSLWDSFHTFHPAILLSNYWPQILHESDIFLSFSFHQNMIIITIYYFPSSICLFCPQIHSIHYYYIFHCFPITCFCETFLIFFIYLSSFFNHWGTPKPSM